MIVKTATTTALNLTHSQASEEYKKQIKIVFDAGKKGDYVVWYQDGGDVYLEAEVE